METSTEKTKSMTVETNEGQCHAKFEVEGKMVEQAMSFN